VWASYAPTGKLASSVLPRIISNQKLRVTNQYHNPLAVEPESAKDAARKITVSDFLQTPPRSSRMRPPNSKDFFK
jgi:hypothetical protein